MDFIHRTFFFEALMSNRSQNECRRVRKINPYARQSSDFGQNDKQLQKRKTKLNK